MKSRVFFTLLVGLLSAGVFGQSVKRMDPYDVKYEPGVVLVKFDENVDVPLGKDGRMGKVAPSDVQAVFSKYGIQQGERLFPEAQRGQQLQNVRTFGGEEHKAGSLFNIMRFRFDTKNDAKIVAGEISKQKGVVYAEPDYIFSALETIPNDALYSQQWYLPVIHAPEAWDTTTGDTTQLIAIIDTGVDWDHPDLDDKIKINWAEYNGAAGVDDDGNGYIDDIRGWDFVNNDNNPNDDNSHGTHVAGIAAAETNNGTGVAGVSWGSKILPVKVLQSTGYGSSSTVAQGVNYARLRGAKVINLSLGSYSESITLRTALENAYSTAVLVAAAGNDDTPIDYDPTRRIPGFPMFPACYGWVIGVEATKQTWDEKYGWRASFSNYDPSGPVNFNNSNGYNYELKAPGVLIQSTLPNGIYGNLSGTSMASPIVSATVALLRTQNPSISNELLLGNLINGLGNTLDALSAMKQIPEPDLQYVSYALVDTLAGCDRDGRPDAGETVQIWLTVKNVWGHADSVWSKLRLDALEDPSVALVTDSTGFIINGLSAYATATGQSNPFRLQISSSMANNRQIVFNYTIGCKNGGIQSTGNLILTIQKGVEVGGLIATNTIWRNDNVYIIVDNIRIAENVKLTIEPGTEIRFDPDKTIDVRGGIKAIGNKDSLILFTRNKSALAGGIYVNSNITDSCIFKYSIFEYMGNNAVCFEGGSQIKTIEDCIFRYNGPYVLALVGSARKLSFIRNNVIYNKGSYIALGNVQPGIIERVVRFNNFIRNTSTSSFNSTLMMDYYAFDGLTDLSKNNIFGNLTGLGIEMNFNFSGSSTYGDISRNYWGVIDSVKIKKSIYDFFYFSGWPIAKFWPYLTQPSDSAHGIVWKVLVNSKNPQEENIDPIGIETVRFDAYFNRAMDIAFSPNVTFGVRDPYTQHLVEDNTSWSADSTIWTAYYTVGLETGDGINTIRVEGAKDTDHFEIPIENRRFQFTIDAAGSAANDFLATVGVGKVNLEWPKAPTEDLLGYNMYRFYNVTDTTFSDTTRINTVLLTDSLYTDFAVIPDTTYHYMYKVVGTDMAESDYSKAVAATPVNASSGDANGDLSVNVQDIVAIVNYILEENPQPFLLEAADVNNDGSVNVLDIVGVVNIILGLPKRMIAEHTADPATLAIKESSIIMTTPIPVYAMQFTVTGKDLGKCMLKPTVALNGFEIGKNETLDRIKVIVYTLKGGTLPSGENALFMVEGGKDLSLSEVVFVDRNGAMIPTGVVGSIPVVHQFELHPNYPNPFNPETRIKYGLPTASKVSITIYNVLGQRVRMFEEGIKPAGYHEVVWDGKVESGLLAGSGIYLCRFEAGEFIKVKKMTLVR